MDDFNLSLGRLIAEWAQALRDVASGARRGTGHPAGVDIKTGERLQANNCCRAFSGPLRLRLTLSAVGDDLDGLSLRTSRSLYGSVLMNNMANISDISEALLGGIPTHRSGLDGGSREVGRKLLRECS